MQKKDQNLQTPFTGKAFKYFERKDLSKNKSKNQ